MKSRSGFTRIAVALAATLALAACATDQDNRHRAHHPEGGGSAQPAAGMMADHPPTGAQMPMMDMKTMCDMHRKMMAAHTPEEQKAMMAEGMKGMSPEMMQQHMAMMREKCK